MPRNLDGRVELLVPVLDDECKRKAIDILKLCISDKVRARRITSAGKYVRPDSRNSGVRSQHHFQQQAREAEEHAFEENRRMFVPQQPN